MTATSPREWTAEELRDRLFAGERFFVLDVRAREEWESWRIEGRVPMPQRNEPYFELLELAGSDEPRASAAALLAKPDAPPLPKEGTVLVVCAKGGSSAFVATGLRELGRDAVNLAGGMQAWAATTSTLPVARGGDLEIFQIGRPARGCLSHVLASRGEAAIVDPLHDAAPYHALLAAEGLRARWVIDTHAHADHVSGGAPLARSLGVPYMLHPYDAIHPMDLLPATLGYEPMRDGQSIPLGATALEVLHVSGHTLGNVTLRAGRHLVAGDTIFIGSIARPDLGGHGESWAALHWRSLRRLLALGDDVVVLPGHFSALAEAGPDATFQAPLGELRRRNEGLVEAQKSEQEFVAYILAHLPEFPPQYVEIKRVNLGLSSPDEDGISELEIGRNVCAMAHAAAQ